MFNFEVKLGIIIFSIITAVFSTNTAYAQDWELYRPISSEAQLFDSHTEWLDSAILYWGNLKNKPIISKKYIQGLNRTQTLDHHTSASIQSLSATILSQLVQDGFTIQFQCIDEQCGSPKDWYSEFAPLSSDGSKKQKFILAIRNTRGSTDYGEFIQVYLNEIGCCVRSTWSYLDNTKLLSIDNINHQLNSSGKLILPATIFDNDSYTLSNAAKASLINLSGYLLEGKDKFWVVGHTDIRGSEDYNMKLSKQRAESVYQYLLDSGVSPTKISTKNLGPYAPIAPNQTAQGRLLNRRVELVIRISL